MHDAALVHVVDDDDGVRDSLAFLLQASGFRVQSYASAVELLAEQSLAPGCIVSDIRMPEVSGLDLLRRLRTNGAHHPVVLITGHADVPLAIEALRLGVSGFIEKPFDDEVIIDAVQRALSVDSADLEADDRRVAVARLARLTEEERTVLAGVVAGKPNRTLVEELGLSVRAIEVCRANLMTKMEARGLSDLIRLALLAEGPSG